MESLYLKKMIRSPFIIVVCLICESLYRLFYISTENNQKKWPWGKNTHGVRSILTDLKSKAKR